MTGPPPPAMNASPQTERAAAFAIVSSLVLAVVKMLTGWLGSSYVLIADGIESLADAASSTMVIAAHRYSLRPADKGHPYGHGRADSIAALGVAAVLLGACALIAHQSIVEIRHPHRIPAWFTLPVLLAVIAAKILVSWHLARAGREAGSTAIESDAWHHLSDAITSGAAFIGIAIALFGGDGWESADDWAALVACGVIAWNGLRMLFAGVNELMDASVDPELERALLEIAQGVEGVRAIEKMRIRKSGAGLFMDIHVEVDGDLTVVASHEIAGAVKSRLRGAGRRVVDVTVHIEPWRAAKN